MDKYILTISIPIETELEEKMVIRDARDALRLLKNHGIENVYLGVETNITEGCTVSIYNIAKVSLTRDGDRAGGNLLLPKLEGRLGQHYQGKKANLKDIV